MIVVRPMIAIVSIIPMLPMIPILAMCRNIPICGDIPIYRYISTFAIPVVPAMFRAIVGVDAPVVDIIPPEYAPWILHNLVSHRRMVSQEVSYFVVLIEIIAVVN
jgi:hypothetical protein